MWKILGLLVLFIDSSTIIIVSASYLTFSLTVREAIAAAGLLLVAASWKAPSVNKHQLFHPLNQVDAHTSECCCCCCCCEPDARQEQHRPRKQVLSPSLFFVFILRSIIMMDTLALRLSQLDLFLYRDSLLASRSTAIPCRGRRPISPWEGWNRGKGVRQAGECSSSEDACW